MIRQLVHFRFKGKIVGTAIVPPECNQLQSQNITLPRKIVVRCNKNSSTASAFTDQKLYRAYRLTNTKLYVLSDDKGRQRIMLPDSPCWHLLPASENGEYGLFSIVEEKSIDKSSDYGKLST